MLRYRVHFTGPTGIDDHITVTAETLEGIMEQARAGVERMGGEYLYEEEIEEPSALILGLRRIDKIPQEHRFYARILLIVQQLLLDGNTSTKPFNDWTIDDIIEAAQRYKSGDLP